MGSAHLLSKGSRLGQYVFILPCESALCCLIWTDSNTHTLVWDSFHVFSSFSVSCCASARGGQLLYSQFVSSACLTVLPLTTSQPFGAVHTDHTHLSESHVYRPHSWSLKFTRSRSWNCPDTCLLYNNKEWTQWYNTLNGAQIYNKCLFFCFSRFTAQMQNNCIKRKRERKKKQASKLNSQKYQSSSDFMLAVSPDIDSRDVLQIWRWFLGKWTNYLNYKKVYKSYHV